MRVEEVLRRSAVAVGPDRPVAEVAGVMEAAGVGALGVVDDLHYLLGIVTDRDLVRRVLAKSLPPDARVDSVMSTPVVTIGSDADVEDAFALFHSNALRRLAVVAEGRFVGILSVDDLLINLSANLADLTRPITAEVLFGHHDSSPPATRNE